MTPTPIWLEDAMRKYRQKLDHVKLRPQLALLIPTLTDKTAVAQAQNHMILMKVKAVLDKEGIYADMRLSYYDYALALDYSQRTFDFMVDLIREHQILRHKWETKGLDPDILDKLDDLLIFRR